MGRAAGDVGVSEKGVRGGGWTCGGVRVTISEMPELVSLNSICNHSKAGCLVGVPGWVKENTHRGARTHDHKVKSLALYRLS